MLQAHTSTGVDKWASLGDPHPENAASWCTDLSTRGSVHAWIAGDAEPPSEANSASVLDCGGQSRPGRWELGAPASRRRSRVPRTRAAPPQGPAQPAWLARESIRYSASTLISGGTSSSST